MAILSSLSVSSAVQLSIDICVHRVFIGPIAQLVFKQERFEGDLRMAFVRLRNRAQDIAILQGEKMELLNLNDKLRVLLKYQLKVVMWHWLLSACIEVSNHIFHSSSGPHCTFYKHTFVSTYRHWTTGEAF